MPARRPDPAVSAALLLFALVLALPGSDPFVEAGKVIMFAVGLYYR